MGHFTLTGAGQRSRGAVYRCTSLLVCVLTSLSQASSVIDVRTYCRSDRTVNIFPYVYSRSVILKFTPPTTASAKSPSPPSTHSRDGQVSSAESQQMFNGNTTFVSANRLNATDPPEANKTKLGNMNPGRRKEPRNAMDRLFARDDDNAKQLGKCRILFKCGEDSCKQMVYHHSNRADQIAQSRKSANLRILDGKLRGYPELFQPSHIQLHIGPADISNDELCGDDNYCQTSGPFLTVAYDVSNAHWFEPFNVTLTLFITKKEASGACPWSYVMCRRQSGVCIPRSLMCDGHRNCGPDDDTDERHCAGGSWTSTHRPTPSYLTPTKNTNNVNPSVYDTVTPNQVETLEAWITSSLALLLCSLVLVACSIAVVMCCVMRKMRKDSRLSHHQNTFCHAVRQYPFLRTACVPPPQYREAGQITETSSSVLVPPPCFCAEKDNAPFLCDTIVMPPYSERIHPPDYPSHESDRK